MGVMDIRESGDKCIVCNIQLDPFEKYLGYGMCLFHVDEARKAERNES